MIALGILVAADSTPTLNLGREETTGGVSYVRSVPRGWSVNGLGCELCLVRIDGERTTGHWRQVYDVGPFGDSQVLAIFESAAAVIHMG